MKRPEGFDRPKPQPAGPPARAKKARPARSKPAAPAGPAKTPRAGKTPRAEKVPRTGKAPSERRVRPAAGPAKKELRVAARQRRRYEKDEIRRFTRRARNRRRGWLAALGVMLGLGGLLAVAVYSPLLALREVTVEGTAAVSAEKVRDAVDGQLGTPLALLDYDRIRAELDGFPLIRSYVTEVVPPGTLRIHVVERAPIGSVATATGYTVVDPAGVVLSSDGSRPPGLPLIDTGSSGTDGVAFRAIVAVLLALPVELRSTVDSASAGSRDDVTLLLAGSGQQVVWGSAERSALKARVLQELLATRPASARVEYDVSAPLSPVVRSR